MSTLLRVEIPLRLPSAGNMHEHWRARAARIKTQRNAVMLLRSGGRFLPVIAALTRGENLVCLLTRISPRPLDSDNLAFAFKGVRDQIAAELGVDDGSSAIEWRYQQTAGQQAARIEIRRRLAVCPTCGAGVAP